MVAGFGLFVKGGAVTAAGTTTPDFGFDFGWGCCGGTRGAGGRR